VSEFRVSYDREARAAYVRFTDEPVARTREVVPDSVWIDLDASGRIVGFEAISVDEERLPGLFHAIEDALGQIIGEIDEKELAIA
jgi:uncharacterized protein YuzE